MNDDFLPELRAADEAIRRSKVEEQALERGVNLSDSCPTPIAEEFVNSIDQWESAGWTTHLEILAREGYSPPAAESLSDERLPAVLHELFERLADLRVFFSQTNHLSDRECYEWLLENLSEEQVKDMSSEESSSYHVDPLGSCGEEDMRLWLRFYADEEDRADWARDSPNDPIPPHEDPPFNRDRALPRSEIG